MATRIRTLKFLPEVFQTTTNAQFLGASLDQIVDQPNTMPIEGYIGSKFGYGINAKDNYVVEPTKVRTDYQLDPGVVFTKTNTAQATDFITYPGIIDALKYNGGLTQNNDRLFNSQFYSWDPFVDLDKLINFNQYYWLPEGAPAVNIATGLVYTTSNYIVQDQPNNYIISSETNPSGTADPILTLIRGGTYTFTVDQADSFWIQGKPGVTGLDPQQPNIQTRDVLGVSNNGISEGTVTFSVPYKDAQSQYNLPGNILVDLVATVPYNTINGQPVSYVDNIDGVTSLDGLTVMFYEQNDSESGNPADISATVYTISIIPGFSPTYQLIPTFTISTNEKITVNYGVQWKARNFYRNIQGTITLVPYLSSLLDTLYYQDGSIPSKVGIIKLIDSNSSNQIDVDAAILGRLNYTAPNGVVFTNGLKVTFSGDVVPTSYLSGEYYVQGVGTGINLISTENLIVPQLFTAGAYSPFDVLNYDIGNYDSTLYVPVTPDYMTIARDSIDKNPWSRSNRWFHVDVINATASYLNDPDIANQFATQANKAKRPIIEFYPNLKLFNNCIVGKQPVDFFDTRTTDAFTEVSGKLSYYPDVEVYTAYTATINASPTISSGDFLVGQLYVISTLGTTNFDALGATEVVAGVFTIGQQYIISSIGTTDFTLIGASSNTVGLTFTATGVGTGTGSAYVPAFTATSTGRFYAGSFVIGESYTITTLGTTDFTLIGASSNEVGVTFTATGVGTGTGTAAQGSGTATATSYTTITVPASDVVGTFLVGEYIADSEEVLPRNATIQAIEGDATLTLTVDWPSATPVSSSTNVSLVANQISIDDYAVYDGARIVFSVDENAGVRNKIYVVRFSTVEVGEIPVITLTEVEDGLVLADEGVFAFKGYYNIGDDFYFDGTDWFLAQQKSSVNQPPLFDIIDKNNISFGNKSVYVGSSFTGDKLFTYGVGFGMNDTVLGFPLRYSSVNNVGDISFDVTLNTATFDYLKGITPTTVNVNTGYVLNTTLESGVYNNYKQLGWQTAIAESRQYQILTFNYDAANPTSTFVCDVAASPTTETIWPNIKLFVNNQIQSTSSFTAVVGATTTTITFTVPDAAVDTIIEVAILSDQVSKQGYYEIPTNLGNNPFNENITTVNIGDIRGQYQSIFYNNPNTTGQVFGSNNYRDLGNLVPWGNKIIQNSASLVLPGAFLRKSDNNLIDSIQYNSQQYIIFKNMLINSVANTSYNSIQTPATMLDDAMDQITASKTDTGPFFWSDMLPTKAAYVTNTYTFANALDTSIYPLSRVYDFSTANYYGVLVYVTRNEVDIQLIINQDYTVSTESPSLTVTFDLLQNDVVTIKEYNQTFGSYVPNTPSKMGMYPAWIPHVQLDSNYLQPTYFIVGHDGSFNKLYGTYTNGVLDDARDQVLLEFETRIYNNLKLSNTIPLRDYDIVPGYFRDTKFSYDEFIKIYSQFFLNWVGQNRIEYKPQVYLANNQFTYNYSQSNNKLDNSVIQQGFWRGFYQYLYDTSTPESTPWEMIGLTTQPSWWTSRYGPAPYTSDNLVLWGDLAAGINWNDGDPIVISQYIRPGLLEVLPVDSNGNLLSPYMGAVGNFNPSTFKRDWKVGDVGPAEFSYRRSSSWPFDLMKILSLTEPANFFNLNVDIDNYKYNSEFNQFLVNDNRHLVISDIEVYGSGTAKTSYINWVVDYQKQFGIDSTSVITSILDNLDVRLIYRLAGFSDKNLLNFYVEKGTPNSKNASLLIPSESYSVLLYDNVPFTQISYSSVIVQSTPTGWKVFGNSQTDAFFTIMRPKINGNYSTVTVDSISVQVAEEYFDDTLIVPYGTDFYSAQELSQFLNSYGRYLEIQGVLSDQIESGLDVNWSQMTAEFLYWIQSGWEIGSIVNLNPAANAITINKDSYVVQPLTLQKQNFILNQNLYPIQAVDLSVVRDGTLFTAKPLNEGDTVAYGQFNISNFEHGVVFDNTTLFNDTLYNLVTGLRQIRILLRGVKTADWNGTVDAQGFVLNQDNIQEWNPIVKYTKGSIVLYKNKYWFALRVIDPSAVFQQLDWKETSYNEIQKGLLPNASTRSYESGLFYNTNKANLDKDADLLSWSLIGYRPRDYLALADLTDITQVNVYKNMIKSKGTRVAANAFKGLTLPQGGIDYNIYENWAIKTGEFGGVLNDNFVDFKLYPSLLTGNPALVSLSNGTPVEGSEQEVQLYSLFNYGRAITDPNVLPTLPVDQTPNSLPDAGYVSFEDVKTYAYYYDGLNTATTPISKLYVGEYVWIADYKGTWKVFAPTSIGSIVTVINNLNDTATIQFSVPHNLSKYEPFAIINFNTDVDGYRVALSIVDPYSVTVSLSLPATTVILTGLGVGLRFDTSRISTPADILSLDLIDTEFATSRVWVDTNSDGSWAVLQKSLNYGYDTSITKEGSSSFGSAVAFNNELGYLVADSNLGQVNRYEYNAVDNTYVLQNKNPNYPDVPGSSPWTIQKEVSFGSSITYEDNVYAISEPTSSLPAVYIYKLVVTQLLNELQLSQTINAPTETAGSFVIGTTYYISSVGTTDFTLIGASSNEVGIEFTATGVGSGTGTATTVSNWGHSTALSTDTNWLYISAYEQNLVYAYRKSQLTGLYEFSQTITVPTLNSTDKFGFSIRTSYYGDYIFVGAPGTESSTGISNFGGSYVVERVVQNYNTRYSSNPYTPVIIPLAVTPSTATITVTQTSDTPTPSNIFTCDNTAQFNDGADGTPIVFSGNTFGGVSTNTVYYVKEVINSTDITISRTRDGDVFVPSYATGSMTITAQIEPLYVTVNGTLLEDNSYSVIGSNLSVYGTIIVGSIITISTSQFVVVESETTAGPTNVSCQFGYTMDCDSYGNEWLVGSPYEINDFVEGIIYRFTNGGAKYGNITGVSECNVTAASHILINGYLVVIPAGDAEAIATAINQAAVPNILATASTDTNILTIFVNDTTVAFAENMLRLTVLDTTMLAQLGINVFTSTQVINCPHSEERSQFGQAIKFNQAESFVASAPVGSRFSETTFDMSQDADYTNDTLFDNNATQFIDQNVNAGAAYIFEYLEVYNESLQNPGVFVFAQDTNSLDIDYGNQPYYGTALDFNDNTVVLGTPNMLPDSLGGQVVVYKNSTGQPDWAVYRSTSPVVDTGAIQNTQIYSAITNNTLINLDYIDPLQGKILGAVRQNIDVVSNVDPASYNSPEATNNGKIIWGATQVGKLWFDTSTVKFVNYHQNNEIVYNSKWWAKTFPGSDVKVYSWITSDVLPIDYAGPGTPFSIDDYAVEFTQSSTGAIVPVYFYWVRNTNIVFTKTGKTLSDRICEAYIAEPQSTGIAYLAPIQSNVFGLYNTGEYIATNDAVLHIGYATGLSGDDSHSVYSLIRANYADDFLPGLPGTNGALVPESLYNRMLESLSGVDNSGNVVPDPFLPKAVQSGILVRPRQSFFYNRFNALKNYIEFANQILLQYPINESVNATFPYEHGAVNPSTVNNPNWDGPELLFFNTPDYWEYVNWWAPGYSDSTKSAMLVQSYYDLAYINASEGLIVTVNKNGAGVQETYIYTLGEWVRIGLQYGTLQFKSSLWDYSTASIGFGNNFFDAVPFDTYPSEETKYIVRTINEQLPGDLLIYRNQLLILLFQYIISETIESQNFIPWLNKTSFIDVAHTIRELLPLEVFQSDNQEFLEGYLNEVKPYHVVIKDFLFEYTGIDVYASNVTDFDVPATYNSSYATYISPQLVYSNPDNIYQYLPENPIWQTAPYTDWFNNLGISLVGENNYYLGNLESYVSLNTNQMLVNNIYGFPINGIITIGTEQISYSSVDLATNTISGLTRGVNGTVVQTHIPGEKIYTDLPSVVLLDGGRGYVEPPKVTAYIDTSIYPAPRTPAILQPVMNLDSVLRIDVIDPGEGYVVAPEIRIDPSVSITFDSSAVDVDASTVSLSTQLFQTGDLVQYTVGADTDAIGGLFDGQYYYINVISTTPLCVIAFYTMYAECLQDTNRVVFFDAGSGANQNIAVNARAIAIAASSTTRENQITMRFDRTTYRSDIVDWRPAGYYGSFFAGLYNNSTDIASSAIRLYSDGNDNQPEISTILASAQGIAFEIQDVTNDRVINWASRPRLTVDTNITLANAVTLAPDTGGLLETEFLGPTTGFYITMPIKFVGAAFGAITADTTYYVAYIFDLTSIAISTESSTTDAGSFVPTQTYVITDLGNTNWNAIGASGTPALGTVFTATGVGSGTGTAYEIVVLPSATAPASGLRAFSGEVLDTAIVTINYPGILEVTATNATTNTVTVPLTTSGLGGTAGFYRGLPVFFVGTPFGNIMPNDIYYVLSVLDNQTFTMAKTNEPIVLTVYSSTTSTLSVELTDELNVNDPFILNDMVGTVEVNEFAGLLQGTIYYVQSIPSATTITVAEYINGPAITLSVETAGAGTQATLVSQSTALQLTTSTGSMTMNVGLPISPGQITGQYFTLYDTSGEIDGGSSSGIEGTISGLYTRTAIGAQDTRLYIEESSGGISDIYSNFPFRLTNGYAGLTAGTTYWVKGSGYTTQEVTASSSSTNRFTVSSVEGFYVDMKVEFSGPVFGNVESNTVYFVEYVDTGTNEFTVKTTLAGAVFPLSSGTGSMTVTSLNPYVEVSSTLGGSAITLSTPLISSDTMTQYIAPSDVPSFFVGYILGGYTVQIKNTGKGFAYNNTITVDGALIGGESGTNDLYMSVDKLSVSVVSSSDSDNTLKLQSTANLNIDDAFVLTDIVVAGVSETSFGGLNAGTTYYIKTVDTSTNDITVSATVGGSELTLTTVAPQSTTYATFNTAGNILSTINSGTPPGVSVGYYLKVISNNQLAVFSNSSLTVPVSGIDFPFVGVSSTTVTAVTASNDRFTVADSSIFSINDPIVFTGSVFGGVVLGQTYYVKDKPIITDPQTWITISSAINGTVLNVVSDASGSMTVAKSGDFAFLAEPFYFQQSIVKYQNKVWQCVVSNNDNEFILGKWELLSSDDRKLNELDRIIGYYQPTANMPGLDISQLITGTTYPNGTYIDNEFAPVNEFEYDTYLQDQSFIPTNVDAVAVTWNGTNYIGVINSSTYTAVITSPDELNWTIIQLANNPVSATDIAYGDGVYVISTSNPATPIYVSTNGIVYSTGTNVRIPGFDVYVESRGLNSVATYNGVWVGVGDNIVTSTDSYNWYETRSAVPDEQLTHVNGINVPFFQGFIAVGYADSVLYRGSFVLLSVDGGNTWNRVTPSSFSLYSLQSVCGGTDTIVIVGDNGIIFTSSNGSNWSQQTSPVSENLNDVIFGNGLFVAVGDNGTIIVSADNGVTWTDESYSTTSSLNGITFDTNNGDFVIVGNNNITLESSDGYTWTEFSVYSQIPSVYTIQGDPFTSGYGPEELVPGVVTDNLVMTVTSRPGSNWDSNEYGNFGYNVSSIEITPSLTQVEFSFGDSGSSPATLAVFNIDSSTGLSTRLYETDTLTTRDYTVNWVAKTITLTTPLGAGRTLQIDSYEAGNGDQIERSSSDFNPFIQNSQSGFTELELDCYYTASVTSGSGAIRPSDDPTDIICSGTASGSNTITCEFVNYFVINGAIKFSGDTSTSGLVVGTRYFVKTIDFTSNAITVSETLVNGIAGPTVTLTTVTVDILATIQVGTGLPWSDPLVAHNGNVLALGETLPIFSSTATTNVLTTTITTGLVENNPITFGNDAPGGITPFTTYYVKDVVSDQTFTISETQGGAVVTLSTETVTSYAVTNDYAIGQTSVGTLAKLVFANQYTSSSDYVAYAVFGQTTPEQFGYTIPVTQIIDPLGTYPFILTNNVSGTNPENAIVEVDGVRISPSDYTIDDQAQTLSFTAGAPVATTIAVTTYNMTENQYFVTQNNITGLQFNQIAGINNTISPVLAVTGVTETKSSGIVVANNTNNFFIGSTIQFYVPSPSDPDLGNIHTTDGTVYFVAAVPAGIFTIGNSYTIVSLGTTDFTLIGATSNTVGEVFTATGVGSGTGTALGSTEFCLTEEPNGSIMTQINDTATVATTASVGGQPAVRVTTTVANGFVTNDIVKFAGISGSVQLNDQTYYVHVIGDPSTSTQFDLYLASYDPGIAAANQPVTSITTYSGGGYAWVDQSLVIHGFDTSSISSNFITVSSTVGLVAGTQVYFGGEGYVVSDTIDNIVIGQKYFVKEISGNTFSISETFGGSVFALTNDPAVVLTVSQWEQFDLARIWVTVNGERVAPSALTLTARNVEGDLSPVSNDLGILSPISASDVIIITSMIPTSTPSETRYIQITNKAGVASVFRENPNEVTFLTEALQYTSTTVYVSNVTHLVNVDTQSLNAPAPVDGVITIGLSQDKNEISSVTVYNGRTLQNLPAGAYVVGIEGTVPVVRITSGVIVNDPLVITVVVGNLIYIDGEMIRFSQVDLDTNSITGLQRGVNGTAVRTLIPEYADVFRISSQNRLASEEYNRTWNNRLADSYNTVLGDPLQISTTVAANFLNSLN